MPAKLGSLDKLGNACLTFHLCGVAHTPPGVEYTGIIDTGFTGFVSLPLQYAFALALPLLGTASITLADGKSVTCFTALGTATVVDVTMPGVVILSPESQDILVGMDFLRKFKMSLVLAKEMVVLLEDDWLEKTLEAAKKAAAKAAPEASPAPNTTSNDSKDDSGEPGEKGPDEGAAKTD
jgi:predicted aspartyl protease